VETALQPFDCGHDVASAAQDEQAPLKHSSAAPQRVPFGAIPVSEQDAPLVVQIWAPTWHTFAGVHVVPGAGEHATQLPLSQYIPLPHAVSFGLFVP
jgi:hypothetical protein